MPLEPRVLIHIDERRRDVAVLFALGRLFERAGARVDLTTRRTTSTFLRRCRYDAILIPSHGQIPDSERNRICSRSKVYLFPTEGAWFGEGALLVRFAGGYDPSRWDAQIRQIQRCFLWGDYSRRTLLQTGRFREEKLTVVGAPRMDCLLAAPAEEERRRAEPGSLGAISEFVVTNPYIADDIFRAVHRARNRYGLYHAPTRNIEDRYWIEVGCLRVWFAFLEECLNRGERVRLRIHPRENLENYGSLLERYGKALILDDQELPFEAWLGRIGVLFGFNSTAFFEVVAAGHPAVNLEGLLGPRLAEHTDGFPQNHYPIMDFVEAPSTWDEVFGYVRQVREGRWDGRCAYGPEAQAVLADVCRFPRTVSSLAAVVDTVIADLGGPAPGRGDGGAGELRAVVESRLLEWNTFGLRRDKVTSSWFPLEERRLRHRHAAAIARYLRAAAAFPAVAEAGSNGSQPHAAPSAVGLRGKA